MSLNIIGLSGYGRAGKDEAARGLMEVGYKRLAFADKLREALYILDPYVAPNIRLSWVVDEHGWDEAKARHNEEIRKLLQRMGTEVGRNLLGENIWVDATLDGLPGGDYVITDCRFVNEANGILARGGRVIRINRPGNGPVNDHISEVALDHYKGFYAILNNVGSVQDLHNKIRDYVVTQSVA